MQPVAHVFDPCRYCFKTKKSASEVVRRKAEGRSESQDRVLINRANARSLLKVRLSPDSAADIPVGPRCARSRCADQSAATAATFGRSLAEVGGAPAAAKVRGGAISPLQPCHHQGAGIFLGSTLPLFRSRPRSTEMMLPLHRNATAIAIADCSGDSFEGVYPGNTRPHAPDPG